MFPGPYVASIQINEAVLETDGILIEKHRNEPEIVTNKLHFLSDFHFLKQFFNYTLDETAQKTGCCTTSIKKICRDLGIKRWPQRKIKTLSENINKIRETLSNQQIKNSLKKEEITHLENNLAYLQKVLQIFTDQPNLNLNHYFPQKTRFLELQKKKDIEEIIEKRKNTQKNPTQTKKQQTSSASEISAGISKEHSKLSPTKKYKAIKIATVNDKKNQENLTQTEIERIHLVDKMSDAISNLENTAASPHQDITNVAYPTFTIGYKRKLEEYQKTYPENYENPEKLFNWVKNFPMETYDRIKFINS